MNSRLNSQRGFTLIELIISMVITAILAAITAFFILGPVKGYIDTAQRAELMDVADLSLRHMSFEIGMALPNSLRITDDGTTVYLEFIPTIAGGGYLDEFSAQGAGNFLDFTDSTKLTFDVVGVMPGNIAAGDYVVVYNLGQDAAGNRYVPADAYADGDGCNACNRAMVASVSGNTITLANNVFAQQEPPLPSPSSRFHVLPGTRAVTYACASTGRGELRRHENYGFHAAQADAIAALGSSGSSTLIATRARCAISYQADTSQRNGLLSLRLTLFDREGGESVSLMREAHLDNSP